MITDFHSHILPRIDDGSESLEESLAMLQLESRQGIRTVVATPHFYAHHDSPDRFLKRRKEAEDLLREAMSEHTGMPDLEIGAEVYFFPGISESEALPALTISGKRCILIEMPLSPWTDSMYRELEAIYSRQGLLPIIAHLDRYISPLRTYGIPERLADLPVLVQANAGFFLHATTRPLAMRLLREDKIQLLGSDCHNMHSRKPNLGDAVQKIRKRLGPSVLERIAQCQDSVLAPHSL